MTQDQQRALAEKRSKEAQAEAKRLNAGYTPGPWQLWTSCSWRRFCTQDGSPVAVPTVARDGHPDLAVSQANARLIAAAPDLLEALNDWIPGAEAMGWSTNKARAAIAKATGTPPPSDTGADWAAPQPEGEAS